MRAAVKAVLEGDVTLMAILTGGVHTKAEISRQGTPTAFDANEEIEPCALLKVESVTPVGPYRHSARMFLTLYWYERSGYDNIEAARARGYTLLHRTCVSPSTGSCWEIVHGGDVLDQEDQALGCSMAVSRYVATIMRA